MMQKKSLLVQQIATNLDLLLPTILTEIQFLNVSELWFKQSTCLFIFYLMDSELLNLVLLNIFWRTNNSTVSVPAAIFFFNCKKQQQLIPVLSFRFYYRRTADQMQNATWRLRR